MVETYMVKTPPPYARVRTLDEVSGGAKVKTLDARVRTISEVNADVREERYNFIKTKRGN